MVVCEVSSPQLMLLTAAAYADSTCAGTHAAGTRRDKYGGHDQPNEVPHVVSDADICIPIEP